MNSNCLKTEIPTKSAEALSEHTVFLFFLSFLFKKGGSLTKSTLENLLVYHTSLTMITTTVAKKLDASTEISYGDWGSRLIKKNYNQVK